MKMIDPVQVFHQIISLSVDFISFILWRFNYMNQSIKATLKSQQEKTNKQTNKGEKGKRKQN